LRDEIEKIHEAGAELVVVGSGTPEQAGWFAEDARLTTPIFTDPSLEVHRGLALRRGISGILDPRALFRAARAWLRGFRQSGMQGDATELGGLFVIGAGGKLIYEYRARFAGDSPRAKDFLPLL
jgi:hypothetical protein